ncbi:MAG: putative N-acetylmannosamine-6-phosphate 2-epimerase [Erysipelotrichaceae bacterium]
MITKEQVLKRIKNQAIISCQAYEPSPHAHCEDMVKMAQCAVLAGSVGLRVNDPVYVKAIREACGEEVIIIGIWKIMIEGNDVYITPTMEAVDALVEAGSNIIALDCTDRINAYGTLGYDLVPQIKAKYPNIVVMADCSTYEEMLKAKDAGVDIVSSTLCGYTEYTKDRYADHPDYELIEKMVTIKDVIALAEGRIWTVEDMQKCFEMGVDTVVIGTAITNPYLIAKRFMKYQTEYFK